METKKILNSSWKNLLPTILFPRSNYLISELLRVAIVGIGNEFNSDDAAGVQVARQLGLQDYSKESENVLVIEAGQAPENITAELRRFSPQVVLMIDAAQMDIEPGQIAWIPWEITTGMSASSHSLPLSMLARYLELEFSCRVYLLGIQPVQNVPYGDMSLSVQFAIDDIVQTLYEILFGKPLTMGKCE